jgi:hypothetical protein
VTVAELSSTSLLFKETEMSFLFHKRPMNSVHREPAEAQVMIITHAHPLRQYDSLSDLEPITCKIQAFRDIVTISFSYSLFVFQVRKVAKYAVDHAPNLDPQITA